MAKEKPRDPARRRLSASSWRRCLRQWRVWSWLSRGVELCEGGAQRVAARGVRKFVFLDEASDRRRYCGVLLVGKIAAEQAATVVKAAKEAKKRT
jgi:hypothetical protein